MSFAEEDFKIHGRTIPHAVESEFMTGSDQKFWWMLMQSSQDVVTRMWQYYKPNVYAFTRSILEELTYNGNPFGAMVDNRLSREDQQQLFDKVLGQCKPAHTIVVPAHPGHDHLRPTMGEEMGIRTVHVNKFTTVDSFLFTMFWFHDRKKYRFTNEMDNFDWRSLYDRINGYYAGGHTIDARVNTTNTVTDFVDLAVHGKWDDIQDQIELLLQVKLDKKLFDMLSSHWENNRLKEFTEWRQQHVTQDLRDQIQQYMLESDYNRKENGAR